VSYSGRCGAKKEKEKKRKEKETKEKKKPGIGASLCEAPCKFFNTTQQGMVLFFST
jgi:hypothetical protein